MRLLHHFLLGLAVACVLTEIVCVALEPGAFTISMFFVTLVFLGVNFWGWREFR